MNCDVDQEYLESGRAACPEGQASLKLSQVIDAAMQVVRDITAGVDGLFNTLHEKGIPTTDPAWGVSDIKVAVPGGSVTSKIPERALRIERIKKPGCHGPISGGYKL